MKIKGIFNYILWDLGVRVYISKFTQPQKKINYYNSKKEKIIILK